MKLELDIGDGVIGGVIGREGEVGVGGVEVAGWRGLSSKITSLLIIHFPTGSQNFQPL
jgi:hypothetical protein